MNDSLFKYLHYLDSIFLHHPVRGILVYKGTSFYCPASLKTLPYFSDMNSDVRFCNSYFSFKLDI